MSLDLTVDKIFFTILHFSYIFWVGDLNFRLEENTFSHEQIVELIKGNQDENREKLLQKDTLNQERKKGTAFHELEENSPTFPPTYKFKIGTDTYDTK